jgi:Saxitoxin biosynthesis operon protein SxtJ
MSRVADHHEFGARAVTTETSSDRSFGLVFAGFFTLLSGYNWWHGGRLYWLWLAVAIVFLALALTVPHVLAPLNRAWAKLGHLLGMVVTPIVMGLVFFIVMTPIAVLMRAVGKDPLRLRDETGTGSYWIVRQPPGPPGDTMRDQF